MSARVGVVTRLLRRSCPVCERHKWYRDPYVKARPGCSESWHRRQYGRWTRKANAARPPLALVPSSAKRCLVHDETYTSVCRGCRADEIAAEETSA